jgi:hypothetical protein
MYLKAICVSFLNDDYFKNFQLNYINNEIVIDETTKVLKLEPTNFSHKLTITNELPADLPHFRQLIN